ncbi:MAG TPA: HAD family phosphatase [Candidatus Saccharimonadales bacterium]|nr:HAD family phosphatase [Candidatus Saccharimonadales bacterium]
MARFEAIHFDMDGVIADTEPLHVAAERQTCTDYGFDVNPEDWTGFKGRRAEDIFNHLIEHYGDPAVHTADSLIDHKTNLFLELAKDRLKPIDGVLDFLAWARESHKKVSLVTSSNRRIQDFIVGTLGIRDLFDTFVNGNDITKGKPHPQPYWMALKSVGVAGNKSVVIEDSSSGIRSAKSAGCSVLAIATSHSPQELKLERPDFIAEDYLYARNLLA